MDQSAQRSRDNNQKTSPDEVGGVKYSIIVVAYNIEDYIARAIESVEEQTYRNFELIVVDDASTDHTPEIILRLEKRFPNLIFRRNPVNKNAGGARNAGLEIARGEYIIFLDGDDQLADKNVLQRLDNVIKDDQADVVFLGFEISGDRTEIVIPTRETCTKTYKTALDPYPNPWSKCWRRDFLNQNQIRFPENRFYEDVLFIYRGIMKASNYKIANFVVHKYTSGRKGSMTTRMDFKNIEDTVLNLRDFMRLRETDYTPEIDLILKKEIKMCKKRLDGLAAVMMRRD